MPPSVAASGRASVVASAAASCPGWASKVLASWVLASTSGGLDVDPKQPPAASPIPATKVANVAPASARTTPSRIPMTLI
jgi:hypothetical protein